MILKIKCNSQIYIQFFAHLFQPLLDPIKVTLMLAELEPEIRRVLHGLKYIEISLIENDQFAKICLFFSILFIYMRNFIIIFFLS